VRLPLVVCLAVASAVGVVPALATTPAPPAAVAGAPAPPAPYRDPWFAKKCRVHHFREAQVPKLDAYPDDPLCVDYVKRDITVDNGGAVRFAEAEPFRFAIAGKPCRYWQTDHWSIQVDRAYGAIVRWDGSYWWDKGRGVGGALMRNFRVAGQPAGPWQAAAAIETVSPPLAAAIRQYAAGPGGGGGVYFTLPGGQPGCPA
jgi:hypothetical protein